MFNVLIIKTKYNFIEIVKLQIKTSAVHEIKCLIYNIVGTNHKNIIFVICLNR